MKRIKAIPLCACKCGERVVKSQNYKGYNVFIRGHQNKGKKCPGQSLRMSGKNNPLFGKHHSDKTREKMRKARLGKYNGKNNSMFGKHHTEEFCLAQSERMKERMLGEGNPNWQGGIAAEPYCDIWLDEDYKESILERDNHTCQNPSCWHVTDKLCIHHTDYIKKNCGPWNLITLCLSCNGRANFNRKYWQELYQKIIIEKYEYKQAS